MCKIFEYRVMVLIEKNEDTIEVRPKYLMQLIGMKNLILQSSFKDDFASFYPLFDTYNNIVGT